MNSLQPLSSCRHTQHFLIFYGACVTTDCACTDLISFFPKFAPLQFVFFSKILQQQGNQSKVKWTIAQNKKVKSIFRFGQRFCCLIQPTDSFFPSLYVCSPFPYFSKSYPTTNQKNEQLGHLLTNALSPFWA